MYLKKNRIFSTFRSILIQISHYKSGEKIGIIGRTGAGKSSLISALYRIRNPSSGRIFFNGCSTLGLHELRKNLSIIPQDPIIFSDTVRKNLDPFDIYEDAHLWDVLQSVGLKSKFSSDGKGI